jgi:hypothetical protein
MGQAPPSKAQRIHFEGRNCDGIDSKFKQRRYEIFRWRRRKAADACASSAAPVDHGAEDIETQNLNVRQKLQCSFLSRRLSATRGWRSPAASRPPLRSSSS